MTQERKYIQGNTFMVLTSEMIICTTQKWANKMAKKTSMSDTSLSSWKNWGGGFPFRGTPPCSSLRMKRQLLTDLNPPPNTLSTSLLLWILGKSVPAAAGPVLSLLVSHRGGFLVSGFSSSHLAPSHGIRTAGREQTFFLLSPGWKPFQMLVLGWNDSEAGSVLSGKVTCLACQRPWVWCSVPKQRNSRSMQVYFCCYSEAQTQGLGLLR